MSIQSTIVRILVVHQNYLFGGQPGGSRFNEFARLWSNAGHNVTVIAGTVNYTTGEVPSHLRGRWLTRERDGQVAVWRCHVPRSYFGSYLGRMWAFLGFTFSATSAALLVRRVDIVIASSPPLITALPGWLAARFRLFRVPLIFEVRDLWPESAVTTGVLHHGSLITGALYRLERWACTVAQRINVLTPAFRDDLIRRGLANDEKLVMVPNGADIDLFSPGPRDNAVRREFGWGERIVVTYTGAHGRANALNQLLDASALLKNRPDILLACVGDGPERSTLELSARTRGLNNIMFCGPQPKERMPDFVNASDIGAAVLQKNPTFKTVYPNKVFDYMACERPILIAIDGVARQLVCEEARSGVYAEPENAAAIAAAICKLADDPGCRAKMAKQGRQWVLANASRSSLAERYLNIMSELVGV